MQRLRFALILSGIVFLLGSVVPALAPMPAQIVNGVGRATVRNLKPGATTLHWQLHAKIPGVWR